VSELRIRSEAGPDADWAMPFLPPSVRNDDDFFDDGDDFGALLAAAERTLTALFGLPVTLRLARPAETVDCKPRPRVAPELASLLATLRLGGDPGRIGQATGVALTRHAAAIVAALDEAAARDWPTTSRLRQLDLDVSCVVAEGSVDGEALMIAPPRQPPPPPPSPIIALRQEVLTLPMRIRVELAAEMRLVASLLPLRAGQVLALAPPPEMPLILGRHCIGRAIVTPLPDGRQQAELVAIGIQQLGDRE
jgi:flagellar motor switch/type III secretory pathway protein FliN